MTGLLDPFRNWRNKRKWHEYVDEESLRMLFEYQCLIIQRKILMPDLQKASMCLNGHSRMILYVPWKHGKDML